MAKIKVHELAKELEIKSKDVITFLQEKGVDVKAAQSSIEGDAVEWVKKEVRSAEIRSRPIKRDSSRIGRQRTQTEGAGGESGNGRKRRRRLRQYRLRAGRNRQRINRI